MILRDFEIYLKEIEGLKVFTFKYILLVLSGYSGSFNLSKELRNISQKNYIRCGKGRNCETYITPLGFVEYISKSHRLDNLEKEDILQQLKKDGLVDKNILLSLSRKELCFSSELTEFLNVFGLTVKKQVVIEPYIVDFVVNDLVIEYDENKHASYDKDKEIKREHDIKDRGYRFIRVNDTMTPCRAIGLIAKELL